MPGWQSDAVDFLAGNILLGYSSGGARLAVLHSKKTRSGRQVVDTAERHRRVKAEAAIYVNQTLGPALEIWRSPPSFSSDCCNRDTGAPCPIAWDRHILFRVREHGIAPSACVRADSVSLFFGTTWCYTSKKYPLRHRDSCSLQEPTDGTWRARKERADQLEIVNKIVGGV